jgi:outer membrane protein TolC
MRARNAVLVAVLVGGCSSGPKYKIDDASLAQIPLAEKQQVLAAQNEQLQAKEELRKAKADYDQVDRDLDIANNEYKSAKLTLDSAELTKKSADQSGDMNKKNQAARDLHIAQLGVKAGDAKVSWLEKKLKWVKANREAAERQVEAADAKCELEKAKLASAKGIKPSDNFNVLNFETESLEKTKKYSESKLEADRKKPDVDDLERKFTAIFQEYQNARGSNPQASAPQ